MKKKLDRHGLVLNRVKQSIEYINRALESYPEDACRLYYDYSQRYLLPVDRNTQLSLYEQPGNIFLCEKHFTKPVTLQEIYDLVYEHISLIAEYREKRATEAKRRSFVVTQEEWEYLTQALEEYRNKR